MVARAFRPALILLVPLILLAARPCLAQREDTDAGGRSPADLEAQILEEQESAERRWVGLLRARVTYPQRLSGGIGTLAARLPADYDCRTVCDYSGLMLQIEPGLTGGQLSAGWARVLGEKKNNKFFLHDVYVGFGAKAVLMRTWGDSPLRPQNQTLAGVEGEFTIARVNFSLGLLHSLADRPEDRWVITGGIGWGF
jgi:hypothetical protein